MHTKNSIRMDFGIYLFLQNLKEYKVCFRNSDYKFQFFIENMSLCNMTKIIVFFVKRLLSNYKMCFNKDEITEI
jgi:hypothetical protein